MPRRKSETEEAAAIVDDHPGRDRPRDGVDLLAEVVDYAVEALVGERVELYVALSAPQVQSPEVFFEDASDEPYFRDRRCCPASGRR